MRKKVALITGASGGIGKLIAEEFAENDFDLILQYNKNDIDLSIFSEKIKVSKIKFDFNDILKITDFLCSAFEIYGKIDVLVNNISSFNESNMDSVSFENFIEDLKLNAWSSFELSRCFCKRNFLGSIINVLDSKITGQDKEHFAYHMSKIILTQFTKELALEYAPNYRVNAVAPGLINFNDNKNLNFDNLPLKKTGNAKDVAKAVFYLANADFITGQIIFTDGGRHIRN